MLHQKVPYPLGDGVATNVNLALEDDNAAATAPKFVGRGKARYPGADDSHVNRHRRTP